MTEINRELKAVIDNDLCIACGACIPACPREQLVPAFNDYRGANEVEFLAASDCSGCAAPCVEVCPSIEIDFSAISDPPRPIPERDGWIDSVYVGYSPKFQDDARSSSGGVLRAVAHFAAEANLPVLSLAKLEGASIEYRPRILSSKADLELMPGSIYHSISFVGAIEKLRELDRPCILIAIPCQLAGILNYITKIEPQLREKIACTCGIVCGWMYSHHAHQYFLDRKNLSITLNDISYRGGDRIGRLKFLSDEKEYSFDRRKFADSMSALDYQSAFSTDLNRLRCRVCQDHTNMLADIVAGDAWLERKQEEKVSIIGVRTPRGKRFFDSLVQSGYLVAEPGSFSDFIESQSKNLVYSQTAQKLSAWLLKRQRIVTPKYKFASVDEHARFGFSESVSFALEILRRHVVRRQYYSLFSWLYVGKKLARKLVSALAKVNNRVAKLLRAENAE